MEEFFAKLLQSMEDDYEKLDIEIMYSETLTEEIMLPMSDGVKLKTYIYYGKGISKDSSLPVILQRSPYPYCMDFYQMHGKTWRSAVLFIFCSFAVEPNILRENGSQM